MMVFYEMIYESTLSDVDNEFLDALEDWIDAVFDAHKDSRC